jgi:VIT1/CCC1 family predicted Fe2+/Mn2+ transporter
MPTLPGGHGRGLVGVVPLVAYLLPVGPQYRFWLAAGMTLLTLFAVGAARSLVAELRWFRSGLEMLVVGATAAYGIGALLSSLTGMQVTGVG